MRLSVFLALLVATGCGAGSANRPRMLVGSGIFPPVVTMLSPSTAAVNTGAFTLTVVGNNFAPDAVLYWNGLPTSTTLISSKQLMAQITDVDLEIVGSVPIFVRSA
ncbi:MAG: IPT/TIG domain-containing protein, partial [Acidobacteria bacterium]|nr:IPT/TIG domain-containing protein [Acidobacteriota bacterium]